MPVSDNGVCQYLAASEETLSNFGSTGGGWSIARKRTDNNGEFELQVSAAQQALDAYYLGSKYCDQSEKGEEI